MRVVRAFALRLRSALRSIAGSNESDAELREELESHLAMQTAENIRRGMSADDARRAALLEAGNLTNGAESVHEQRGLPLLENLASDVRYSIRALRNKPGFSAAVILTLALGIGANTAMFTIINAVILRPLPYPEPDRILWLSGTAKGEPRPADEGTYAAWRAAASTVMLGAHSTTSGLLATPNGPRKLNGMLMRDDYFAVFGARPALGRGFSRDEQALNGPRVVILGDSTWRTDFAADSSVLGKSIDISGAPATVIGVMSASFNERHAQFWMPLRLRNDPATLFFTDVVARVRDGVSVDVAAAQLRAISARTDATRISALKSDVVVRTLHDSRFGSRRRPLLILFAAVTVLLIIACANIANLNLARANSRRREIAVRLALGAGRWRIVRGMLCESLLLSFAGALLGVAIARLGVSYLVHLSPTSVANADAISIDLPVLSFTFAIAVITAVAFGLSPAITAVRADINSVLSASGGRAAGGRRYQLVRSTLVVGQLATALLLLTVAGLVARTFWNVTAIDAGFRADHLITTSIPLYLRRYPTERLAPFYGEVLARIRALPNVVDVALADAAPLSGRRMTITPPDTAQSKVQIDVMAVGPRYFETVGARLNGRSFTADDREKSQPVVILNATYARTVFGQTNPIGTLLKIDGAERLVVGVSADIQQRELETTQNALVYFPIAQYDATSGETILIRVNGASKATTTAIAEIVRSIDATLPRPVFIEADKILRDATAPRRFTFVLLGVFAAIAAALAVVGLYGLLAHLVADRTREIGIRLALGADSQRVLRLVLGQGVVLVLIGVVVGLGASLLAVRAAESLIFGVSVYDPRTFVVSASSLAIVCVMASWLPARRASAVDPILALRAE
ncbi:MAG TPA: ABC transporter permease [Gemmatimonadaceae bacterium]|jgi:predicted permease